MYFTSEFYATPCNLMDLYLLEPYSLSCKYMKEMRLGLLFGYCEDAWCIEKQTIDYIQSPPDFPIYFKYRANNVKPYMENVLSELYKVLLKNKKVKITPQLRRTYEQFLNKLELLEAYLEKPLSEIDHIRRIFQSNVGKRGIYLT